MPPRKTFSASLAHVQRAPLPLTPPNAFSTLRGQRTTRGHAWNIVTATTTFSSAIPLAVRNISRIPTTRSGSPSSTYRCASPALLPSRAPLFGCYPPLLSVTISLQRCLVLANQSQKPPAFHTLLVVYLKRPSSARHVQHRLPRPGDRDRQKGY